MRKRPPKHDGTARNDRKRNRQMDRLREEFATLSYPNAGAYSSVPTVVGGLTGRPQIERALMLVYKAAEAIPEPRQTDRMKWALDRVRDAAKEPHDTPDQSGPVRNGATRS